MDIKGHAAIVTGGASGLGAATAGMLAQAGAKVACLDVNLDGAAAVVVVNGDCFTWSNLTKPPARILAGAAVGVPPEIMGIGPAPAIRAVLAKAGLKLADIDRFEINEAFGAQVMACARELGIDEAKLNVNGGAIAIGHPLGATGVRLAITLARELKRSGTRYGIASACIGGGQGIAMVIENTHRPPRPA